MSKNELADVRAWLLEAERYEDVIRFDKSSKDKERLYNEMTGREPDTEPDTEPESEPERYTYEHVLYRANQLAKIKDKYIADLRKSNKILLGIIDTYRQMLENK